jgi:hypothetical protein
MVALALNQTVSTQKTPSIAVDPGILPGRYRIQLVVTDTTNGQSTPTFVQLTIMALPPPPPPPPPPIPPVPPGVHPEQPVPPILQPHPPIVHPDQPVIP